MLKTSLTSPTRSDNMRRIRSRDSKPEMIIRKLLFAQGYRYRLYSKDLPGRPDIVFRGRKKVIFVHGCFWHSHADCRLAHKPLTNQSYWTPKLRRNAERDQRNLAALAQEGWDTFVVWECEVRQLASLEPRLRSFLED